ncbi:MAG TPA: transposase, partial [Bacteroidia bacterium]|nr:transposase [Bacteroidia bacterium]
MSYTQLFVHAVWATKNRRPLMSKHAKDAICEYILTYSRTKNIYVLAMNGWLDHLHALISLKSDQNICTVMNL